MKGWIMSGGPPAASPNPTSPSSVKTSTRTVAPAERLPTHVTWASVNGTARGVARTLVTRILGFSFLVAGAMCGGGSPTQAGHRSRHLKSIRLRPCSLHVSARPGPTVAGGGPELDSGVGHGTTIVQAAGAVAPSGGADWEESRQWRV